MSNTLTFPTLAALTAHAVEAYKAYSGPWPTGPRTEAQRKMIFSRRSAFGLSGVSRLDLEDGEDFYAHVVPMSEMLADEQDAERTENHDFRVIQYYIYAALTQK